MKATVYLVVTVTVNRRKVDVPVIRAIAIKMVTVDQVIRLDKSEFPKVITLSDEKDKKKEKRINARSGPGAFMRAYSVIGKAEEGSYTALSRVSGATVDPSCVDGWYQILRASTDCSIFGNCFTIHKSESTKNSVPEAWVCGDFLKE